MKSVREEEKEMALFLQLVGISILLVSTLLFQAFFANSISAEDKRTGWFKWSTDAVHYPFSEKNSFKILAPNRNVGVIFEDTGFSVEKGGNLLKRDDDDAGFGTIAEALWSPDSKRFAITQSDGGAVGTWYTLVYLLEGGHLRRVDINDIVVKAC